MRRAIAKFRMCPILKVLPTLETQFEFDELEHETRRAWQAYVDGRHTKLLSTLPVILLDGRRLVDSTTDDRKARAYRFLSIAYRLGAGITSRLGFTDLSWMSAEGAFHSAHFCDSPDLETAISLRYLAWTLVCQDRFDEAESVATAAAERIQPAMLDRDAGARSGSSATSCSMQPAQRS